MFGGGAGTCCREEPSVQNPIPNKRKGCTKNFTKLAGLLVGCSKLTSSFVLPAIIFWNPMPTPSITASNTAHPIAPFLAARTPPRIARDPPVMNPAPIAFQGSSRRRMPLIAQSNVLKSPPQTPKLPPSTGARILTAVIAPIRRSPYGLLRNPLMPCQIVPPIAIKEERRG